MVVGDRVRIQVAMSVLPTVPGTTVLPYGRESGGATTCPPNAAGRPPRGRGPFRYQEVNVAEQRRRQTSLLNRVELAIWVRELELDHGERRLDLSA